MSAFTVDPVFEAFFESGMNFYLNIVIPALIPHSRGRVIQWNPTLSGATELCDDTGFNWSPQFNPENAPNASLKGAFDARALSNQSWTYMIKLIAEQANKLRVQYGPEGSLLFTLRSDEKKGKIKGFLTMTDISNAIDDGAASPRLLEFAKTLSMPLPADILEKS